MDGHVALVTRQTGERNGWGQERNSRKRSVLMPVDDHGWGGPKCGLAEFAHERATHLDHSGGRACHVDDTVVRC